MTPPPSPDRSIRERVPEPVKDIARRARRQVRSLRAQTPELSVVIPSYNVLAYIGECLESLLDQTLENLEVIVVDDGSTDGTWEKAREYAARDHRVKVFRQVNSGQGIARNLGVEHARGEFLTFIDSDDTVPPRAFDYMVRTLRKTGSDFCVGSARRFSNKRYMNTAWAKTVHLRDRYGTTIEEFPLAMQDIIACNRMFRTAFWREQVGGFRGHIAYEDHVPMLTAYVRANTFDILSGVTYNWRIREDLTSTSQQKASIENLLDRVAVKEEAHDLLVAEAPRVVYDTWVARAIEVDFPAFIQHALPGGDMYRAILSATYRTFLGRAVPEALGEVRFMQKVRAWLIAEERWDDLELAEDYFREMKNLPTTSVREGHIVADPQEFLSGAPEQIRLLSKLESRFDGALETTRWNADGQLEIGGWAFIRALDMPTPDLTEAWLEEATDGRRVEVTVEGVADPAASIWGRDHHARYDGGGFRVLVDPADLDEGLWQLHVRITQQGVTREGSMHRYTTGGSALLPASRVYAAGEGHRLAKPRHHRQFGFVVEVETPDVVLIDGTVQGTEAAGTLALAPGVDLQRLLVRSGETQNFATLRPVGEGRATFSVSAPAGPAPRQLRADTGADKPVPVVSALPDVTDPEGASWWDRDAGATAVLTGAPSPGQVTGAEIIGDQLVVHLLASALPALDGLGVGNQRLFVPASSVEELGQHIFRATFPLATSVLGGPELPLPTSVLRVRLGEEGEPFLPAAGLVAQAPVPLEHPWLSIKVATPPDSAATFAVTAPLRSNERSLAGQRALQRSYQESTAPLSDSVFFQCYRGEFATDSQRALDEGLRLARPDLTRYWGVLDHSVAVPEGSVPVLFGSQEWYDVLATSRYLCNNIDFDGFFRKRPGQKYLQTFHGYPFKSMGRGFWAGKNYSNERIARELARRNAEYDAILVPSERAAGFYRSEYDYEGEILVTGYPRSDFPVVADRATVRSQVLGRLGVPEGNNVVLYAPTYRDNLTTRTYAARRFDELDLDALTQRLGSTYTLLLRGHNNNQRESSRVNDVAQVVDVTDYPEINELTVAADAAILDYSSLRFDWALTGKPMVFFVPDLATYFGQRPPLFPFAESAPGPLLDTTAEVGSALADLPTLLAGQVDAIASFNEEFNGLHDGHATERVIEAFFSD